jgi:UDP-2,3-diacylglucosamine pyrophosphatase LpxH
MKVIVTSDQHLGYEKSDRNSFSKFLDTLESDLAPTHFVLLGDVVDMWRRDASGVFLESHDILEKILGLTAKMKVCFVAGNHDYHVLHLVKKPDRLYPITFLPDLVLPDGNYQYLFKHGWQYDQEQQPPIMEAMCRAMSDETGDIESNIWNILTRESGFLEWLKSVANRERRKQQIHNLQRGPEERLTDILLRLVEQNACKDVKTNQVLVFGHTHRPFVNKKENVANTGSWVTDAPADYNTYVELSNGKPRLFVFGGQEITDRKDLC